MTSKNNQNERLRKVSMEDKQDRFSIRKLAFGAASVLLGFSFMTASGQIVKADSVNPSDQETSAEGSKQPIKSKTDVTTYAGLHSFLRDSSEETGTEEKQETQTDPTEVKSDEIRTETEGAGSAVSESQQPASAEDLANAAADLQTEIGKGNDFVETDSYKQAAADRQQAVADAITQGQTTVDKYNKFVSTNDDKFKVSLFDLTDAKVTIGAMITAATNVVGTQDAPHPIIPYDGWKLSFSSDSGTLSIDQLSPTDQTNGTSNVLSEFLNGTSGKPNANQVKYIKFIGNVTLKPTNLGHITRGTTNYYFGQLGGFANLKQISGLDKVLIDNKDNIGPCYLFAQDPKLSDLDLTNFNTANVRSMMGMFYGDEALRSITFGDHFDTSQVVDMSVMFNGDKSLQTLDLSMFNTSKVGVGIDPFTGEKGSMSGMFDDDRALTRIDGLEKFDTSNVEDMSLMFASDGSLTSLDVSHFNTSHVKDMYNMFSSVSKVKLLDVSKFDTSQVGTGTRMENGHVIKGSMSGMFDSMNALTSLDVSNFVTNHVIDMSAMFNNDANLTSLDVSKFDTSAVTVAGDPRNTDIHNGNSGLSGMFAGDSSLTSLDISNFSIKGTDNINLSNMFINDTALKTLSLPTSDVTFNTSSVTNMKSMFAALTSLESLDLSKFHFTSSKIAHIEGGIPVSGTSGLLTAAGNSDYFVLTLPQEIISESEDASLGEDRGFIQAVNSNTGGSLDNPKGSQYIVDLDSSPYVNYSLDDMYGSLSHNQGSSVTSPDPIHETYIMAAGPNNTTYIPDGAVTLTIHAGKPKADSNEVINKLNFTTNKTSKHYTASDLKNTIKDPLVKSKNVITDIKWLLGGEIINSNDPDSVNVEPSGTLGSLVNDQDGTLTSDNNIPSTNKEAAVQVTYGDGTMRYLRVKFDIKGAKLKKEADDTTDVKPTFISSQTPFTTSYISSVLRDSMDLIDLAGVPDADISGYTTNLTSNEHMWTTAAGGNGEMPLSLTGKTITVNYSDGSHQDITGVTFNIQSMEKTSSLIGFGNQQTYPIANNLGLLTNMQTNAISQDSNITDVTWVDAIGALNPGPTLTQVGTQSAYVKVSYADSSYKILPIAVQVIAQPKAGIYDGIAYLGSIEVPQYTDIGNDQQAANEAGSSASVPDGTTTNWDDNKLANTSTEGKKGIHFINVTYPDGTAASIPVNIIVGNAVTKDIKLKHNAYVYGADGKRANGITLRSGSTITTYGTKRINDREFYLTKDADYYIAAGNDKPAERKLDQNAYTYNKKGKKLNTALKHKGVTLKTYGAPILIKGKEYYSVGKNRYIKKDNFPPTAETSLPGLNKGSLSTTGSRMRLKHNAYLYDENGNRSNSLILNSGSIIQTHGSKQINGQSYYAVDTGEYINAKNIEDNWIG